MENRRAKLEIAILGAVTFAALLASYSAFRPVRDALILDGDLDQIPWLFLATFAAVSVVSPMWSAFLAKHSRPRSVPLAFHVFAVCEVGFFLAVRSPLDKISVGHVFYVWSAVFNLFVVSVFWSLLADLLGPGIAKQLYGPIAAGGTVGTMIGPLLTKLLVGTIGPAGVLLMSAGLLEFAVIGVYGVRRAAARLDRDPGRDPGPARPERSERPVRPIRPVRDDQPEAPAGGGAFTGIAHVGKSPYLSAIVGYVLCTSCVATFLYFQQAGIVKAAIVDRAARTEYFATVDLCMSGLTLILQTLIARPALGRFGPGLVLMVLPLTQLTGLSILAAAPSLAVLAVVQVIGRATTHGLTRPARELLFTVVSRDEKYRAKNAIDTIGYRFGDLLSSWLQKGLVAVGGVTAVVGGALPIAAIWLGFAFILGAGFRRRVTKEPA